MLHMPQAQIQAQLQHLSEEETANFLERKAKIIKNFMITEEIEDFNNELTVVLKQVEVEDPEEISECLKLFED